MVGDTARSVYVGGTTIRQQGPTPRGPEAKARANGIGAEAGTWRRTAPPPPAIERTILPDGTIVIRYPDGRTRSFLASGETQYLGPDGKPIRLSSVRASVQRLDPPPPPSDKAAKWFERHAADLLDALMSVVEGNRAAAQAGYLKREPSGLSVFQKIDSRTKDLALLVAP